MLLKLANLLKRSSAVGVLIFSACAVSQTSSADVGSLIRSQAKRSEFCTGFNDHHAGFVQYVTTGYPLLIDERAAEEAMTRLSTRDGAIEVLALRFSLDALQEARVHSGWVELGKADSAKVLCFAALSSYDNFLAANPSETPNESGLLAAEKRTFKTLVGLSAGS